MVTKWTERDSAMSQISPMSEKIAESIVHKIDIGEYPPGSRIPNEKELMDMFDTGRGTVREAVKLLVSQRVLEIQRGRGTFVCEIVGVSPDPFGLRFLSEQLLVAELAELRYILEPQIALLACERATEEEIAEARELMEELERESLRIASLPDDDIELYRHVSWLDAEFHNMFCRMTHNEVLMRMIPAISEPLEKAFSKKDFILLYKSSVHKGAHRTMHEALESRDGELLSLLIKHHLKELLRFVRENCS